MPRLEQNENYTGYQCRFENPAIDCFDNVDESLIQDGLHHATRLAHSIALSRGWYHNPATGESIDRNFGEVVALMHSELSEALEAHRKGLMDDHLPNRLGVEVEFADLLIRVLDTCGRYGIDIAGAYLAKCRYNATREDHSLEARRDGGKAY